MGWKSRRQKKAEAARRRRQRRSAAASAAREKAAAIKRTTGTSMPFIGGKLPTGATPGTGGVRTRLAEMARKRLSGAREARRKEKKPVSEF